MPMRMTRRQFFRMATCVVGSQALGLLAACGTQSEVAPAGGTTPSPAIPASTNQVTAVAVVGRTTEWHVVTPDQTGGADPFSEYSTRAMYALPWHVMEPLFYPALSDDGKSWTLVNELAKEWRFVDPTTLVVRLEEGVLFHNGEELTAEHVKVAYDTLMRTDPPTRRVAPLRPLGEAEIVDKYTIRWRLPEPNLAVLGAVYQLLIPPLARQEMTAEEFEREPIGTGPYRVVSWPVNGTVELEAWDKYRKGKVAPDRIIGRYVPDASTRAFELISGSAQIAQAIPIDLVSEISKHDNLEVSALKSAYLIAEVINVFKTRPPLRDVRVRQALNYAIDRDAIVRAILQGYGEPLPGPLAPGWLGYEPRHRPYPYEPDTARRLLSEAGASDLALTWLVNPGSSPKVVEVGQAVASQLAEVGVTVNIEQVETARLLAERNEGNYDIVHLTYGVTWIPTTLFQFTLFTSYPDDKLVPQWGETPEDLAKVRDMYGQAVASSDFSSMHSRLAMVHERIHEEAFWLFVHTVDELWGIAKDTQYRPFPTVYYRWYDEWGRRGLHVPERLNIPLIMG